MNREKYVLVTGAGRGIGRAIALALASAGHMVLAHYHRSAEAARRLREEVVSGGGRMELVGFDLANREETAARLEACLEEYGPPWGVVCNAGICADNAFPALSAEDWDSVLRTNLDGFYNLLHPLVLPMCRARRGRILALTSVAGITGNRGQVNYSASKAGIIGASKALAVELASRSITVNCIAPGVIDTEMIRNAPLDKILPAIPLGRIGRPEEVAALAVFLLSEEAGYITRQVISVNGGMV
ncbi:MAG: 3-oxoacyl-ACP reductase FabG [Desulfovibrionaceae bacterium]|nr:3-oxoacyl-ACP reductase FabG [Desulfovibrionaceae bacterium]